MSDRPCYVALGDSLSLDLYAGGPGRGAASLLYRDDGAFAGFEGRDLRSQFPEMTFVNLAQDGAIAPRVSLDQIHRLDDVAGEPRIVTLTIGGSDLHRIWGDGLQTGEVAARELDHYLGEILGEVRRIAGGDAIVLVGNIYDPTDGTGDYESIGAAAWPDVLRVLDLFNRTIGRAADDHDALLVDLHAGFLGHGTAASDPDHPHHDAEDPTVWYAQRVEPNARGASEIRRLLLDRVEESVHASRP